MREADVGFQSADTIKLVLVPGGRAAPWRSRKHSSRPALQKEKRLKMSGRITFFAAAPIVRRDDAMIMTDSAVECRDAEHAIRVAEQMSQQPGHIGSWAYCRSGNPTTGRYDPVEVLKRFGGI
jgi:hypothetical protein